MAHVVPFPLARRQRYVQRQAEVIAGMKREPGDRYLQRQLEQQSDVLQRRGIAADLIKHETGALERAIRNALWEAVLKPGDHA